MSESALRETVREAVDLRSLLGRLRGSHDRVPLSVALEITASIGEALAAAPADVAPSIVVVASSGGVHVHTSLDASDLPLESIDYLAPERLTLESRTTASTVYALAATLYEMVATDRLGAARGRAEAHRAWVDERLAALHDSELRALLRDCLAFEPARRPTIAQLIAHARAMAHGGESLPAWAARHVAEGTDVVGEAPGGTWYDSSALDVPVTRLPEPSPHDPTYYLPDPTRPRPVQLPDLTDPGIDAEDPPSEHTAPGVATARSTFHDELTDVRPRKGGIGRLVVAGVGVAAAAVAVYALQPRIDAEAGPTLEVDPPAVVDQDTPPPPGVESAVFQSAAEGTVRIVVNCTDASARGATMASVPVAAAATCTVTAILADRDRVSTVVAAPSAGRYRCFVEGSTDCQPE